MAYRYVTKDEMNELDQIRKEHVDEKSIIFSDEIRKLKELIDSHADHDTIVLQNNKVSEADMHLHFARFPLSVISQYTPKNDRIRMKQMDPTSVTNTIYPYPISYITVNPYLVEDQYVRSIENPEAKIKSHVIFSPQIVVAKKKVANNDDAVYSLNPYPTYPSKPYDPTENKPSKYYGKVMIASFKRGAPRPTAPDSSFEKINVTSSQGKQVKERRDFSPMTFIKGKYLKKYINFEAYWQSAKVFGNNVDNRSIKKWWESLTVSMGAKTKHPSIKKGTEVLYSIFDVDGNGNEEKLLYIPARKKVYVPRYYDLMKNTPSAIYWKNEVQNGMNVIIYDLDGPKNSDGSPTIEEVTLELLREKIEDPKHPFGHGYVVAAWLLGIGYENYTGDYNLENQDAKEIIEEDVKDEDVKDEESEVDEESKLESKLEVESKLESKLESESESESEVESESESESEVESESQEMESSTNEDTPIVNFTRKDQPTQTQVKKGGFAEKLQASVSKDSILP